MLILEIGIIVHVNIYSTLVNLDRRINRPKKTKFVKYIYIMILYIKSDLTLI